MVTELKIESKKLYDMDYNLWVLETVKQLKHRDFNSLDLENLIEEVEDLSKRDKRKLKNLLKILLEHLLKLKYWEAERKRCQGYWRGEIANFRQQIRYQLEDSPSLKPYIKSIFVESYQDARYTTSERSQLPLSIFLEKPIAPLEKVLDENWLP